MNLFELFVKIGVDDQASKKISDISGKLGKGLKTAAKVGTAAVATVTAAAGAMTAAFVKGTSEVAQYGYNIDKMSQKMGLSAEAYQEWDFIMQHSGTSMEALKAGMKTLANAVENGNKAFERLGITQEEIASMNQEELFARTLEGLQGVTDETERTYLAGQLLGRGATELGALLNTSAEDVEAMRQQVHELGGVMSNEAVKAAAAYQDSLQNMQTAFSGIQRGMLSEFLPSMVTVMDGLALIFSGNDSGIAKITEGVNQFADKLMESVPKIFELGEGILSSLATAILDNLPTLTSTATRVIIKLASGIISSLPKVAEAAVSITQSLADGISENQEMIITTAMETISYLVTSALSMLPQVVQLGLDLIISIISGVTQAAPTLVDTIFDVVNQLITVITNPDTLVGLINAAIQLILALVEGILDAIPTLLSAAGTIVENLVLAIIEAAPMLLKAAYGIINSLYSALLNPENIALLVIAGMDILFALIEGIGSLLFEIPGLALEIIEMFVGGLSGNLGIANESGSELLQSIADGFMENIDEAAEWGKDLIDNFVEGIKAKWEKLKNTVIEVAETVKDFLGFSEPEKGPLSNFHTYAPDMMELFAKGIRDNENIITDQIEKSFDFGEKIVSAKVSYKKQTQSLNGNDRIVSLLSALLDAVLSGNAEMVQAVMADKSFAVSGREFGRLVREYA